ncbi:transposase [Sorangium sp. So ce315]|uniref:transposase n=1 Tax=Sorangium sp. So ce315 TaxID=3133299 RepID=UPI003F5D959C
MAADISEVSRCFSEEDANDPELRRALAKVVPALYCGLGLAALLGELLLDLVETAGSLADVALLPAFRGQQLPVPGVVTPMFFIESRDLFLCCRKLFLARIRNAEPVESLHRLSVRVRRGKPLPVGVLERGVSCMRKRYTAEQRERLIAEVAAGEGVAVVAARMGVGASATYLWVKEAREGGKPTFAKVVRSSSSSSMVLEVGRARVRVEAGFDAELLRLLALLWAAPGAGEQV